MLAEPPLAALRWPQIGILLFGRLLLNTAFRILYPLLGFLATGLQVEITTASLLLSVQVAATLLSPAGGSLADTYGERFTMLLGLGSFCLGAAFCAIANAFPVFLLGYLLIGLSNALYQPSMQSYASARTPYQRRGKILGLLETSWALAALVGISALSALIQLTGTWHVAFGALFGAGVLGLLGTFVMLPPVQRTHTATQREKLKRYELLLQRNVVTMLLSVFCLLMATELIFVVYSSWLEQDFQATVEQTTQVFAMLGFVELVGSLGSMVLVDRLGKRRTVLIAFGMVALFQGLLPFSAGNWVLFIVLFYLFVLWFEFAIVSLFPLVSGILPQARGLMISLCVATIGMGRLVSTQIGLPIWERWGFMAIGTLAAALTIVGVLICLVFVREGE